MSCGSGNITINTGIAGAQGPTGLSGADGAAVVFQSWLQGAGTGPWGNVSGGVSTPWGGYLTDDGLVGGDPLKYTIPAAASGLVNKGGFTK